MDHYKIKTVTYRFYEKASQDVLIGHHFRKIATEKGIHPLHPPMDAFKDHLPRIEEFWRSQLLGEKIQTPFELIQVHQRLMIRRGELGRWLVLFRETLSEIIENGEAEKRLGRKT